MISLRWRFGVSLLVCILCLAYALPSVPGLGTALQAVLPDKKINLGLDLKGGIHLTLGVDVAKAVSNSLAMTGQDLRRVAKDEQQVIVLRPRVVGGDRLEFLVPRAADESKLQEVLHKFFPQLEVSAPQRGDAGQLRYVARFTAAEVTRLEDLALDQALRTIRNRIDQFGVAEPDIRKQEGHRIQVQLPGLSDPRGRRRISNFILSAAMWTPRSRCCPPASSPCRISRAVRPSKVRNPAALRLSGTPC